jgi:hypothetical protein
MRSTTMVRMTMMTMIMTTMTMIQRTVRHLVRKRVMPYDRN